MPTRLNCSGIMFFQTCLLSLALFTSCSIPRQEPVIGVKIYEHTGPLKVLFDQWEDHGINTAFSSKTLISNPDYRSLAREEWVEFVCPSREDYRKQVVDHAKELVKNFDPDGISIDFIRHFVYWEKVYPDRAPGSLPLTCFDSACMARFQSETGLYYPGSGSNSSAVSDWILHQHPDRWVDWKCSLITTMVEDLYKQTGSQVIPSIQVNKAYLESEMDNKEFRESINEALKPPSHGVIFWSWERLVKDPEKLEMLKDIR